MRRRSAFLVLLLGTGVLLLGAALIARTLPSFFKEGLGWSDTPTSPHPSSPRRGTLLTVTMLDVGQGDAILIQAPDGTDILVDGGPDASVLDGLGTHLGFFDRTIELMLLTNPDADHFQGEIDVLERYKVLQVIESNTPGDARTFRVWEERVTAEGATVTAACDGSEMVLADDVHLRFFNPVCEGGEGTENERSLVFTLTYGETTFLFTGDAPASVESRILESLPDVDVLKVGHHGSRTSTSEEFLSRTRPEVALISAGKDNQYGHPHQEVLERLSRFGIRVMQTATDGEIRCTSDGQQVQCE